MSNYHLLIDIGGTATKIVVATDGVVVNRTELQSFKPQPSNLYTDELCKALGSWLASINETLLVPSFALLGVAGVWDALERHQYLNSFTDSWLAYVGDHVPRCSVLSDVELVHFAAFGPAPGIVLIAGTGSIAVLRNDNGVIQRCGGWGPRIDDAGSGFWIGKQALLAVARELDGRGPSTLLRRPVASHARVDDNNDNALGTAIRQMADSRAARLAPAVLQYASEGDAVANDIVLGAVHALCEQVITLLKNGEQLTKTVCLHGSLFNNKTFTSLVSSELQKQSSVKEIHVLNSLLEQAAYRLHHSSQE